MVELDEHIDFHSSESNGDVNSLITPLGALRKEQGGKQTLEHLVMDEFLEKREEEASRVEKLSKKFLVLMDAFCVFVVQQRKATTQNQKSTKLMNCIVKGLDAIGSTPSEGFAKATIKVRLLDSFAGKETKTKWVQLWLHKVKAYMET
jgi:phage host-nuclease inhibitor protein Gam